MLPFADMSPARDQDCLCDGVAEEIINALTHVRGLRVAARGASFQFRGILAWTLRLLGRAQEARAASREGLKRAERILTLNPEDARALSLGSLALFFDGQVERAMDWSHRSLALHPNDMSTPVPKTAGEAQMTREADGLDRARE